MKPLPEDASPRTSEVIQRILATARAYLDMEVAIVSEFSEGRSVVRFVDTDSSDGPGPSSLDSRLLETYCYRVARGQFPEAIPDTSRFPPARELNVTTDLSIGSYVGVPIVLSGGLVHGVLCCYGKQADPTLTERRVEVVRVLGHLIAETLETDETRRRRDQALRDILRGVVEEGRLELAFQPIVDLRRGTVVGYEALTRIPGPPELRPEEWFLEADRLGIGEALEARVITTALAQGRSRPPNTFLSINVSPNQLHSPEVRAALSHDDLRGVVLEITEHQVVTDYESLQAALSSFRDAGVRVAVDDAGAGYAGLQHLLGIRPEFIKLDRALVEGIDRDEVKLVLAEALGSFAGRIDSWVIAEGIETTSALDALIRLEVPLGQGWALAPVTPAWRGPAEDLVTRIRTRAERRTGGGLTLAPSVEDAPVSLNGDELGQLVQRYSCDPELDVVVVLEPSGAPLGFVNRERVERGEQAPRAGLRVKPTSHAAHVARRATTRPPEERFDPMICVDDAGRYVGVVRFERLVEALAGEP